MATATISRPIDVTIETPGARAPLVIGDHDLASVTDVVCRVPEERRAPIGWKIAFTISVLGFLMFFTSIGILIGTGIGVLGTRSPTFWAWPIVNFVFWIGIGHAGTLISAILFLFRQKWRTSINRAAEAMTIFAVMTAGIFPGIHVGRIWVVYWIFPYPNQMMMWPNFKSPLVWDVFAVSTYFTVSLLFWYLGMVPDLASLRDRAKGKIAQFSYGLLSLGWTGSARGWYRFEKAYIILAAISTPLVLSVHTVVSFDFAVAQLPGWHTTIFPPYFVAGAIFSGFAMVISLLIPARSYFGLKDLITIRHLENMCKIILATGSIVGYAYSMEFFIAMYSGNEFEQFTFWNRVAGNYWWAYWIMVSCNVISPQLFWFKRIRTSPFLMFIVCIFVNIGMWFERFVITVTSLSRDFLPSAWGYFQPTWIDICMLIGSFGFFMTWFLLFCRYLPQIAVAEVKQVMPQAHHHNGKHNGGLSKSASPVHH